MKRATDSLNLQHFLDHWTRAIISLVLTVGLMLSLSGCNTMQGLGKDVEQAGEAIQKSTK